MSTLPRKYYDKSAHKVLDLIDSVEDYLTEATKELSDEDRALFWEELDGIVLGNLQ
jgi:hypothetical protein